MCVLAKGERAKAKRLKGAAARKKKKQKSKKKEFTSKQIYPQIIRCGFLKDKDIIEAFAEESRIAMEIGALDRKKRIGFDHGTLDKHTERMLEIINDSAAYKNAFKVPCPIHCLCVCVCVCQCLMCRIPCLPPSKTLHLIPNPMSYLFLVSGIVSFVSGIVSFVSGLVHAALTSSHRGSRAGLREVAR